MSSEAIPAGARKGVPSGVLVRMAAFVAASAGLGALSGVAWYRIVPLATYTVSDTGRAGTTERALTLFFAGDAWFSVIGAVLGVGIGVGAWFRFRRAGWPVVPMVVLAALLAALCCWQVGSQLGPDDFVHRIAAARPGDVVPIDLTLRAPVTLVVWLFFAVVPVLLGSSLGRDEEDPRSVRRLAPVRSEAPDRSDQGNRSPESPAESR